MVDLRSIGSLFISVGFHNFMVSFMLWNSKNLLIYILQIKYIFCYNLAFTVQTHGARKKNFHWVLPSVKKSRKSQNKIKWKKSNIYGNTWCILSTSLSEPLYFQRLQNCCTELLGNTLRNSCVLRKWSHKC